MTRVLHSTRVHTTRVVQALALVAGLGLLALPGGDAGAQQTGQPATTNDSGKAAKTKAKAAKKPAADADGGAEKTAFDPESALDQAVKALAEGKAPVALGLADQVLAHAGKTPRTTARALSIRGQARLRQGKPAEAISDLDNALWVKDGLGAAERETATTVRAEAYRQAGLGAAPLVPAQRTVAAAAPAPMTAAPPVASAPRPVAALPPASIAAPAAQAAPAQSSGGGFFSNLFGGASSSFDKPDTTAAIPAPPKTAAISSSEPQRATNSAREATAARPPVAREPAAPKVAAATAAASANAAVVRTVQPTEGSQIQLAAVRTREAAMEMAAKVRKDHAAAIGERIFEIDEPVFGNMGKFYRVRIGPFASPTESLGVCSALRNQGVDCMLVAQ